MDKWKEGEEGKTFLVIYEDDTNRIRQKHLIMKKSENGLVWFFNPQTQLSESIPSSSIKRMQEVRA